jgi:alkylhydroperoxidase/carboxymuconolactone decarboxylase family protein YurZ
LALYHLAAGKAEGAERLYQEALSGGAPLHRIRKAIHDLEDLPRVFPDHLQAYAMRDLLQEHLQEAER